MLDCDSDSGWSSEVTSCALKGSKGCSSTGQQGEGDEQEAKARWRKAPHACQLPLTSASHETPKLSPRRAAVVASTHSPLPQTTYTFTLSQPTHLLCFFAWPQGSSFQCLHLADTHRPLATNNTHLRYVPANAPQLTPCLAPGGQFPFLQAPFLFAPLPVPLRLLPMRRTGRLLQSLRPAASCLSSAPDNRGMTSVRADQCGDRSVGTMCSGHFLEVCDAPGAAPLLMAACLSSAPDNRTGVLKQCGNKRAMWGNV